MIDDLMSRRETLTCKTWQKKVEGESIFLMLCCSQILLHTIRETAIAMQKKYFNIQL